MQVEIIMADYVRLGSIVAYRCRQGGGGDDEIPFAMKLDSP
jgi:hypothetical protein